MPLRILSNPTSMRRSRVSFFFAEVAQQIHSLRASGVISFHRSLTVRSDSIALRRSEGRLCTELCDFILIFYQTRSFWFGPALLGIMGVQERSHSGRVRRPGKSVYP